MSLKYQTGFGNNFSTESLTGALPQGQNNPQKVGLGLYAEQLSGSAFTVPRSQNLHTWFYRIRPSVSQGRYRPLEPAVPLFRSRPFQEPTTPEALRWDPFSFPSQPHDFIEGLRTVAGNGDPNGYRGCAVHVYTATRSMGTRFFYNADGELLLVPELGKLLLRTEMGGIEIGPGEIGVLPRGVKFQVEPLEKQVRGYVCENYGQPFRLPDLGVLGANGLAEARDFSYPTAAFEEKTGKFQLVAKYQGHLYQVDLDHSPLDVVGWRGNYSPYKYDLDRFQVMGSISYDHPDPSIFTVLTSPSEIPGTANVDFVLFTARWLVQQHTFRPPYYHRNCMSEYMGLIRGKYDAKPSGFVSGGASLHNSMTPHGPDTESYEKGVTSDLKPQYLPETLAFMFESSLPFQVTAFAREAKELQKDYLDCWKGLNSHFKQG